MRFALLFGAVEARAFKHDVYFKLAPRKVCSVFLFVNFNGFAVNGERSVLVVCGNLVRKRVSALRRVVFEKVRKHRGRSKIVDRNDFISLRFEHLPERKTTDTTESVDCNFYFFCHVNESSDKTFFGSLQSLLPLNIITLFPTFVNAFLNFFPLFPKPLDFFLFSFYNSGKQIRRNFYALSNNH